MPELRILKGSVPATLDFLQALSAPPRLLELTLEPDPIIEMPHDTFADHVMSCLAKCSGTLRLVLKASKSVLRKGAVSAVRRSASSTTSLARVMTLRVDFEDVSDEVIQVGIGHHCTQV